jgi:predicted transcriptional regulator
MGRRRGEVQILTDILEVSVDGVKITRLLYQCNLSYATLRKYLTSAQKQGLVTKTNCSDGSLKYLTTEKGKLLLQKLKEVTDTLRG